MALVTISGFPCSGKSQRAHELSQYMTCKIQDLQLEGVFHSVQIISDDLLGLERSVYDESYSEKPARGTLFTAVQRALAPDKIVILDSLNYIKGFRYQLYCAAREAKCRVCTVYVATKPDLCREWNESRRDEYKYAPETYESFISDNSPTQCIRRLENLFLRYEEPSSMVRWDAPLFITPWTDESLANDAIWEAITKGNIKPPNSGTLNVAKAPSDALQALEHTTSMMVSAIVAEYSAGQFTGGPVNLTLNGSVKVTAILPERDITLSELQRMKRQFVNIHRKSIILGATEKGAVDWDEMNIAGEFAQYLEQNVRQ